MTKKYSFLEKHIHRPTDGKGETITICNTNSFGVVSKEEIEAAERILEQPFPEQLRNFYQEIGTGYLTTPYNPPKNYEFPGVNEILPPLVAAHFYKGIIEHHTIKKKEEALSYDDHWFSHETLEIVEPGDLPFLEVWDSSKFLLMKPNSDNPNAVWVFGNIKIADSFEEFIQKTYYEDPAYYDAIVLEYYKK